MGRFSACVRFAPPIDRERNDSQRLLSAFRYPFFEVFVYAAHLIGHMGETHDCLTARFCKRVQGRRFHFDRENSGMQGRSYCFLGFPKRCIGRPTGSGAHGHSRRRECRARELCQMTSASLYSDAGR
jgi:hypothetical protein